MTNYRRYQPYHVRSTTRPWTIIGWIVVGVVVIILLRNALGGSRKQAGNESEIKLANSTNQNINSEPQAPELTGPELTTRRCPKPISRVAIDQPYISLTLDGGGIVGDSQKVLDIIKEKQVPATLFVTGKWAEEQAATVKAFADAGIEIFSHSYSHQPYTGLTKEEIGKDLEKAETAIIDVTTASPRPYFRPPFGNTNDTVVAELRRLGYCAILWTVDAKDAENDATLESSKQRVLDGLKNGAIIMLQANSDISPQLVGPLIDESRGKGYTFVKLRDLLRGQEVATEVNANENRNVTTTNTNKNANVNKNANTNANKNTNLNKNSNLNKNTNANRNTNAGT